MRTPVGVWRGVRGSTPENVEKLRFIEHNFTLICMKFDSKSVTKIDYPFQTPSPLGKPLQFFVKRETRTKVHSFKEGFFAAQEPCFELILFWFSRRESEIALIYVHIFKNFKLVD